MTSSLSDLRLIRSGRTTGFCSKFKEEHGERPVWQFGSDHLNRHHNQKEAAIGN
jgi:hypothetical protein